MRRAERAIQEVRAAGYPTPAWLAYGQADSGVLYQAQEYVQGRPAEPLTPQTVALPVGVIQQKGDGLLFHGAILGLLVRYSKPAVSSGPCA
jgi:hypothetical protein